MKDIQTAFDIQQVLTPVSVPEFVEKETLLREEAITLSANDWRERLGAARYNVLRESGTERAFNSELVDEKRTGTYVTADCGEPVFRSEHKFDSGSGWPSFWRPVSADAVLLHEDTSHGMTRIEVISRMCGSHLGHVFLDGPQQTASGEPATGLRYCINGAALHFVPDDEVANIA